MKLINKYAILILSAVFSMPALADVTKTVNSPETEIPRISAKKYDFIIGISYSDPGLNGKSGAAPLFPLSRHKVKPSEGNRAMLGVEIPPNATLVGVRGLMRNEPWGGARHPPKAKTDDMGSIDFKPCPMGSGDCPIAYSDVSAYTDHVEPNGKRIITAVFRNWVGRNDRTGMLEVTYTVPN